VGKVLPLHVKCGVHTNQREKKKTGQGKEKYGHKHRFQCLTKRGSCKGSPTGEEKKKRKSKGTNGAGGSFGLGRTAESLNASDGPTRVALSSIFATRNGR